MKHIAIAIALAAAAAAAAAHTTVADAWVRGTVAEQKATGAFARITNSHGGRLVAASSPVAAAVEIHEMAMEGSTMKMRPLPNGLPLPANQAVELKPGGMHLMLLGLKQPLKDGDTVPLKLTVEGADGKRETVDVQAAVRGLGK